MPLLDYTDLQTQKNIDLTSNGIAEANLLANAILTWSANYCNRLTWAYGVQTEYFTFDQYQDTFYVSCLPLDTTQPVTVATYNSATNAYDPYLYTVRANSKGRVKTITPLLYGDEAVQITYTGGYKDPASGGSGLPSDLKQALTDLLVLRFDGTQESGRQLTKVTAGRYSEEYTATDDLPENILMVLNQYRNIPVA